VVDNALANNDEDDEVEGRQIFEVLSATVEGILSFTGLMIVGRVLIEVLF